MRRNQLHRLRRDERFIIADGDAIVYRVLWLADNGRITCADHRGEWCQFEADMEVIYA